MENLLVSIFVSFGTSLLSATMYDYLKKPNMDNQDSPFRHETLCTRITV